MSFSARLLISPLPALHGSARQSALLALYHLQVEGGIFLPYPGPFPPSASLQLYVLTNNNTYLPYTWQNAVTNLIAPPAYPHPPVPPSSTSAMHHTAPTQPILPQPPVPQPKLPAAPSLPSQGANDGVEWDGWPDGEFERSFTHAEFEATKHLQTHWSTFVSGGDRKGKENADSWEAGRRATRDCNGIIKCDGPGCEVLTRPQTKPSGVAKQLQQACICGGVHFSNDGYHNHPRPTHVLHMTASESKRFTEFVTRNPRAGPTRMFAGLPDETGQLRSAADISPALSHPDRISKEKQRVKRGQRADGTNGPFSELQQFDERYPNFLRKSVVGSTTVLCLQTPWMQSQLAADIDDGAEPFLLRSEVRKDGAINGILTDAAHGWWKDRTNLLIVTSLFCTRLCRWVPTLFSYSNGATSKHYEVHFLALMESTAEICKEKGIELKPTFFASVMDFSEAEYQGFILAFVAFWGARPENSKSPEELEEEAKNLLKGCLQHFRAGVTRVSNISGVVLVHHRAAFKKRAMALVNAPSSQKFIEFGLLLLLDFPKVGSWLKWWIRPQVAQRLFSSERTMDPVIWDSLPDSTNAEESLHSQFYAAQGRDHELMEGLAALYAIALYFERLDTTQRKRWKKVASKIGRTKPHRAPDAIKRRRYVNDGRPPDTAAELLHSKKKRPLVVKQAEKRRKKVAAFAAHSNGDGDELFVEERQDATEVKKKAPYILGYRWADNSCWLDTSLMLIYHALMGDPTTATQFMMQISALKPESPMSALGDVLQLQHSLCSRLLSSPSEEREVTDKISAQRNTFKVILHKSKCLLDDAGVHDFQPLTSWVRDLVQTMDSKELYAAYRTFETLVINLHFCSGTAKSLPHARIRSKTTRYCDIVLPSDPFVADCYERDIGAWFKNAYLNIPKKGDYSNNFSPCWRQWDGVSYCEGTHKEIGNICIALPVVLIITTSESYQSSSAKDEPEWNFPSTFYPGTQKEGKSEGLRYKVVGRAFYGGGHFICRFSSGETVYDYDDRTNGGKATRMKGGKISEYISGCGTEASIPLGMRTMSVVYRLEGGFSAQQYFYEKMSASLLQLHDILLSEDLQHLPTASFNSPLYIPSPKDSTLWPGRVKGSMKEYTVDLEKYKTPKASKMLPSTSQIPQSVPRKGLPSLTTATPVTPHPKLYIRLQKRVATEPPAELDVEQEITQAVAKPSRHLAKRRKTSNTIYSSSSEDDYNDTLDEVVKGESGKDVEQDTESEYAEEEYAVHAEEDPPPLFILNSRWGCNEESLACKMNAPEFSMAALLDNDAPCDRYGVPINQPPSMELDTACALCGTQFHSFCVKSRLRAQGVSTADSELVDSEHFDVQVFCRACTSDESHVWERKYTGRFIMIKPMGCSRFYRAEIRGRNGKSALLRWYAGNQYASTDMPPPHPDFKLSIRRTMQSILRDTFGYSEGYTHPAIRTALDKGYSSVLKILKGDVEHPIIELLERWTQNTRSSHKAQQARIMRFRTEFFVPILPADRALLGPFIRRLQDELQWEDIDIDRLMAISEILLSVAVARAYLNLSSAEELQLFALACTKEMHALLLTCTSSSSISLQSLGTHLRGSFKRTLSHDELALLAGSKSDRGAELRELLQENHPVIMEAGTVLLPGKVTYMPWTRGAAVQRDIAIRGFSACPPVVPVVKRSTRNNPPRK
ncbi:hypothetical protein BKA70DRAFT_1222704 [Coprinopsis sp. MPI-PUGE-AT-0042]|nr:hypothetical protein BKA70DRAFT_1222704 [Coprinopsis sp. MPI-PUGE-AT-0042]